MAREWDVMVIGAGVAGLSAARAAAAEGLSCACIDRIGPGGTVMNLTHLHDYPDAVAGTGGADLVAGLMEAASEAGVEMLFGEVTSLDAGEPWRIETDDEPHTARAVVLASGLTTGKLGVVGEEAYEGRGLSHCASCDGPMFAGESVVVDGDDRWAATEAVELAEYAGSVTLVGGASAAHPKVTVRPGRVVAIEGSGGVDAVVVETDGGRERIEAQGVFPYRDRRPQLSFTGGGIDLDTTGRVRVDDDMRASVPFLYAVGDVRASSSETVAQSIADGRRAGLALAGLLKR